MTCTVQFLHNKNRRGIRDYVRSRITYCNYSSSVPQEESQKAQSARVEALSMKVNPERNQLW